jgi:acyl-CoA synthetase (AMP-forming)/AMP-acid ligase II
MQSWIHVIDWRATTRSEVPALIDDRGAQLSYAQLRTALERHAGGWAELGVRPGDVVVILAKNSADFLVQAFALMRAGATPAFVNWRLSAASWRTSSRWSSRSPSRPTSSSPALRRPRLPN